MPQEITDHQLRSGLIMYVLVVGNPFDGLELYGPFRTPPEAHEFAENWFLDEDWQVVPVASPGPAPWR